MRIELENLEKAGGKFSREYQTDQLTFDEQDLRLVEPVQVAGRIRRRNEEVELRGKLATRVAVPCGRCLKSVEFPVEVEFTEWTGVGILRHPSYKGQRDDREPGEVVREVGA